jgi:predicted permease
MTGDSEIPFWIEGQPRPANQNEMPFALFYLITPGYQQAMRIPLERGRFINAHDDERAAAAVVIDSTFARKYFPEQDPVGKRVNIGLLEMQAEIVGVVGHVEHWGLDSRGHQDLQMQIYLSVWQVPDRFWPLMSRGVSWVARTTGAPLSLTRSIREAQAQVDSTAVIFDARPMEEIVSNSIAKQRLTMILLSVFSALALVLSAVGIYGVISYLTGQRTHEIGIRVALGASTSDVLRMILGEGMRITLIGVGIGVAAALALTRLIANVIYGVSAYDPLTFFGVAILLIGVALLACYLPAKRAMRVDPIIALRYE